MGPDLGSLTRVERALEQRAEDRGLHAGPVVLVDGHENVDFLGREGDDLGILEQAAVEAEDRVGAEIAPLGHGGKEVLQPLGELRRVALGALDDAGKQPGGQQADVLAEHTEHQLHEEVGRALGRHAPDAHPVGQLAKAVGGLLGDAFPRYVGPEGMGIVEDLTKDVEVGGLGEPGQVEGVHALGRVSEVGVDLEAVHVADDQQGRVF